MALHTNGRCWVESQKSIHTIQSESQGVEPRICVEYIRCQAAQGRVRAYLCCAQSSVMDDRLECGNNFHFLNQDRIEMFNFDRK